MKKKYITRFTLILAIGWLSCFVGAFAQIGESKEQLQRKLDYYFYDAVNKKAQGKYAEALDLFMHCFALDSTNANVLMELGNFYSVLQSKSNTVKFWEKAVEYDPNNYYYNMSLASLYKDQVKKQQLVHLYEKKQKQYPGRIEVLMNLAMAYADNGEFKKSIDVLNDVERIVGINESIMLNKFQLYSMLNQKGKAFDEIKKLWQKDSQNPRYMMLLGDLYMQDNQTKEGLKYYEMVKQIQPDYPGLVVSMANYYEQIGKKDLAQQELLAAIQNKDMEVDLKIQLLTRYIGILQENKQNIETVNPLFVKLIEQHPTSSKLNMMYGNLLMIENKKPEAMEQFTIYSEANPDDPSGYEQMLRVMLPDSLDKVVKITEKALKYLPEAPQFYYYLGGAKFQQNKHDEALEVFLRGLEQAKFDNPTIESDFCGQIGDLYHEQGKDSLSFQYYEKALKLNLQNLPVLNNYSYYLSLKNRDLPRAEQMSSITVKAEPTNATYLDTYGWILFKQGAYTTAKIYLENAVKHGGNDVSAEVYEHYGDVLFKTEEVDKAVEQWKKAQSLGSTSKVLDKKIKNKQYFE